jgi:protein-tyrosine phosphatase
LYRHDAGQGGALSAEVLDVVWRVREEFLQASLQAIDADYGSMAQYLQQGLGLAEPDLERLRQMYLA